MYRNFHVIRQHDLMQCGAACLARGCVKTLFFEDMNL